ncbi:hypothetical protein B0O99DRAFT_652010 [Bisporella sp. PMI_857]|nr:hypothetical protein B0O99DRAFT_652010 [Bisporella sp. PMI_857]
MPYIHHFITVCCRFLVYANDSEGNPFQDQLVPQAVGCPALLHAMAAVSAGHLDRSQGKHDLEATKHYYMALRELSTTLSDPAVARADSTLGACLLLCVYETSDYLSRWFSLLDVSGALFSGGGTLLEGNYWLENSPCSGKQPTIPNFPAYDPNGSNANHFHELMVYMARMSRLSSESMNKDMDQDIVRHEATKVLHELHLWWQSCPPSIRDQSNDWRRQPRPQKLTIAETLEEEGISSIRSCMHACVIYLNHIINPLAHDHQNYEVQEAISGILDIANETPEGYGLEMGLYFGLFMAGIAVFNNPEVEDLLRRKLKADTRVSIYHADRCLELLEVLWGRQHRYGAKYDWRQVQKQMGISVRIRRSAYSSSTRLNAAYLLLRPCSPTIMQHIYVHECPQRVSTIDTTGMVSEKRKILLLGGTGKVSSRIAPLLVTDGYHVVLASRSGTAPSERGYYGINFNWDDTKTYPDPFAAHSISAVFIVAPFVSEQLPLAKEFIDIAVKSGVKRFVLLSASAFPVGPGPLMAPVAQYLAGLGVQYAVLRPSYFMQNFSEMAHLHTIRDAGQIVTASGDGKVPFVSTNDIAAVAAKALTIENSFNRDILIVGDELFSYGEIAKLMSEALGREITHVDISEDAFAAAVEKFGIEKDYARALAKLETGVKEGKEMIVDDSVLRITGTPPVKFRHFLNEAIERGVWAKK